MFTAVDEQSMKVSIEGGDGGSESDGTRLHIWIMSGGTRKKVWLAKLGTRGVVVVIYSGTIISHGDVCNRRTGFDVGITALG